MIIWLFIFWLAFLLPFNFFPMPDMPNNIASLVLACVAFFVICLKFRAKGLQIPNSFFILLGLLVSLTLSAGVPPEFTYSEYIYLFFLLGACLVSIIVATLIDESESVSQKLVFLLSKTLIWIALITSIYGLLRHYGVLKVWFSWTAHDGQRLSGPLNQANLTALILVFGIASTVYACSIKHFRLSAGISLCILFSIALSLTGTRAALIYLVLLLGLPPLKQFIDKESRLNLPAVRWGKHNTRIILVFAALFVTTAFPAINEPVSGYLAEHQVIEAASDQSIISRLSLGGRNHRLEEWKKLEYANRIIDNMWVGLGAGQYSAFSIRADRLMDEPHRIGKLWVHSHNLLINSFVELGLIGFSIILALLAYLAFLFLKSRHNEENALIFCVLAILVVHNMIEFSFWSFGFLALFVSLLAIPDIKTRIKFSSSYFMPFIGLVFLGASLVTTFYISKDYYHSVKGFGSRELSIKERRSFFSARNNRFIGGAVMTAYLIRNDPLSHSVKRQIEEISSFLDWRPEMIFQIRMTALLAADGHTERACNSAREVVSLFPASTERLLDELDYFAGRIADERQARLEKCISDGILYWMRRDMAPDATMYNPAE